MNAVKRKEMGAFYTDAQVANFLVNWAIRDAMDKVLDPSSGGGVFLQAASARILRLDGRPQHQVFGVEVDPSVHRSVSAELHLQFGLATEQLICSDFFDIRSVDLPAMDAVVGNPPFIRYQRFSGSARAKGLGAAALQGVKLSGLASSWAPFVVHAASFVRPGGRLAMVLPTELLQATYALPVIEYLSLHFRNLTFLTFARRLFPHLNEDTLLLLADGKGEACQNIHWQDYHDASALPTTFDSDSAKKIGRKELLGGGPWLLNNLISPKARQLYLELADETRLVTPFGHVANVGIGYVTGANEFFHPSKTLVETYRLQDAFLRRAVRRGKSLHALRYTEDDWLGAWHRDEGVQLLHVHPDAKLTPEVEAYLAHGQKLGVHEAFKCRSRTPWYSVPNVYQPQAFLSYMSGDYPRLVSNDIGAVAPNSLHTVRIYPHTGLTGEAIAALWYTSLTRLSCELEGRSLGGGMLKLEPRDAARVLLPWWPGSTVEQLTEVTDTLDSLVRRNRSEEALAYANKKILQGGLGLSEGDVRILTEAAHALRERRQKRGG